MKQLAVILCVGVLVALASTVAKADSASSYWGESWTDSSNFYNSPDTTKISGTLPQVIASIPTDALQSSGYTSSDGGGGSILDGVNYVRTFSSLPGASSYYGGSLLGDLSSKTSFTAQFSLSNSMLSPGAAFPVSDFVAYTIPVSEGGTGLPTPSLRLTFTGADGDVWYSTLGVSALSMQNDVPVSLTASLNPSDWSDINGVQGTSDVAGFESGLTDVTRLGLAFGSGYFYANGFAFDTGGSASLNIDSISASPTPEPGMIASLLGLAGMGLVGLVWRRKKAA